MSATCATGCGQRWANLPYANSKQQKGSVTLPFFIAFVAIGSRL